MNEIRNSVLIHFGKELDRFYTLSRLDNTRSVARLQDWVLRTVVLPRHLANIIAIVNLSTWIPWLWDFAVFQAEISVPLMDDTLTIPLPMMTSSNGNFVRVTGLLWGESIGHGWFPGTKASDAELWCCFFMCASTNGWTTRSNAGDMERHGSQWRHCNAERYFTGA